MTTATATEAKPNTSIVRTDTEADALSRALNFDFTQPLAFVALAVLYVVSRAPFLNIGYGTDPDAWRVALSGYWLWDHHEYYPSRLPGYPVPEFASAAVIKAGGALATNSLTLLISLVGLWFFAQIAAKLDLPNRGAIVIAFAFTPLLWINSMTTMDYMWALTFILASYYFLIQRNSMIAGIMLGLAIGSRSTSALMLLPLLAYMWRDGRKHEMRPFFVSMLAVTLIAWTPVYWRYGPAMMTFYDAKVGYLNVLRLLGKDTLGLFGSMAVIAAIAISLPRLARLPADFVRDKHVMVWVLAIAVTVLAFARLPHEAAYLIPVYPFGFFLMAKYFQKWVLAGAIAVILLAGWVDLTSPGEEIDTSAFTNASLGKGLVLSNRETMENQIDYVHEVERLDIGGKTVVSLGFVYPQFAVMNRDRLRTDILELDEDSISQLSDRGKSVDEEHDVIYVWLLQWDDFQRLKSEGYTFMHTLDAGRSTAGLYDYRPALLGSIPIDLGHGPSGGRGAARTDR
jgi:hypothetical protein